MIKIAKRHLYTVTQGRVLTYEKYSILLTQIEAILNSRSLTPLSSDPADLFVLTPAHFLVGGPLLQPVQPNHLDKLDNHFSRWQQIQKLSQRFWERWHSEYLLELQKRTKWTISGDKVQKGMLVILKEDNLPLLQWMMGCVTAVHPGLDGELRVVTGRIKSEILKHPVRK